MEQSIRKFKVENIQKISKEIYNLIKKYVLNKGGFIDTQNTDKKKDYIYADTIELGGDGEVRGEKYIYGIKVVNDRILIATEYIPIEIDEETPVWTKEDFDNEKSWLDLLNGKCFVTLPTLFCIADCIEQY